jgi:hypothetical protein
VGGIRMSFETDADRRNTELKEELKSMVKDATYCASLIDGVIDPEIEGSNDWNGEFLEDISDLQSILYTFRDRLREYLRKYN